MECHSMVGPYCWTAANHWGITKSGPMSSLSPFLAYTGRQRVHTYPKREVIVFYIQSLLFFGVSWALPVKSLSTYIQDIKKKKKKKNKGGERRNKKKKKT